MCCDNTKVVIDGIVDLLKYSVPFGVAYFAYTWADNRKNEKTYNLFKDYLPRQVKSTNQLIDFLNSLILKLQGELSFDIGSFAIPVQPFFILDSISKIDLHKALESKFNKKKLDFFETTTALNFLQKQYDTIFTNHKIFVDDIETIKLDLNNKMKEFHDTKGKLLGVEKSQIANNSNLLFLNTVYNEWTNVEKSPIERTIKILLEPLKNHFQIEHDKTPNDNDIREVLTRVQRINFIYTNFAKYRKDYVKVLQDSVDAIKKELLQLE